MVLPPELWQRQAGRSRSATGAAGISRIPYRAGTREMGLLTVSVSAAESAGGSDDEGSPHGQQDVWRIALMDAVPDPGSPLVTE